MMVLYMVMSNMIRYEKHSSYRRQDALQRDVYALLIAVRVRLYLFLLLVDEC